MRTVAKNLLLSGLVGAIAALAPSAYGAVIPIANPSFENPFQSGPFNDNPDNGIFSQDFDSNPQAPGDWLRIGNSDGGEFIPNNTTSPNEPNPCNAGTQGCTAHVPVFNSIQDGNQVGYINAGTVRQILTSTLLPNQVYTLTFYVGQRNGYIEIPQFDVVIGSTNGTTFTQAIAYQYAGYVFDATHRDPFATGQNTNTANGTWTPITIVLNTNTLPGGAPPVGQNIYIQVDNQGAPLGGKSQLDLDAFSLSDTFTPSPEPASFLLLGGGLLSVALLRRRTSQQ